jgi:hypothetical protein
MRRENENVAKRSAAVPIVFKYLSIHKRAF